MCPYPGTYEPVEAGPQWISSQHLATTQPYTKDYNIEGIIEVGKIIFPGKSIIIGYPAPNSQHKNIQMSSIICSEQFILGIYIYSIYLFIFSIYNYKLYKYK